MFCPQCGKDVIDGAVFCPKCGYRMDQLDAYEEAKAQERAEQGEQQTGYDEQLGDSQAPTYDYSEQQSANEYWTQESADGYSAQQQSNDYPSQQPVNGYPAQQPTTGYEQTDNEQQGMNSYGIPYEQQGVGYNTSDPNWVSTPPFVDNFIRMYTQKYVEFNGRATRKEYWTYAIAYFIVMMFFAFISKFLFDKPEILTNLFAVASFLPNLALTARRLHDSGRSGLWAVGIYIPFVNIALFIFMFLGSTPGPNQYGPLPVFDASRNLHIYK